MANKYNPVGSSLNMKSDTTWMKIGSLTSIGEFGGTADEMETTTLDTDTGYKEFMGGFRDSGSISIGGLMTEGETDNHHLVEANFDAGVAVDWYVQIGKQVEGGAVPKYFQFKGFVQDYKFGSVEVGSPVPFNFTIRVSGKIAEIETAPAMLGEMPKQEMFENSNPRRR